MADALVLALAVALAFAGAAWIALAMETHWQQACPDRPYPDRPGVRLLRTLGGAAWLAALWLCLRVDHGSIAVLVWLMSLTVASVGVAFLLAGRPRALRAWAVWAARPRPRRGA